MATCEGCCHLTGAMLNLAAEAADRARIILVQLTLLTNGPFPLAFFARVSPSAMAPPPNCFLCFDHARDRARKAKETVSLHKAAPLATVNGLWTLYNTGTHLITEIGPG
jgi:hypothetical protein